MSDSIFNISVENCFEKLINSKEKLFYEIKITYDKEEWKMEKTFNEFKDLHVRIPSYCIYTTYELQEVLYNVVTILFTAIWCDYNGVNKVNQFTLSFHFELSLCSR